MNRSARRNAKQKRKAFNKAMEQKQPSNDKDKEPIHNGVPFWEVYPVTITPRLFLGSSSAHRQFVGNNEENFI